MSVSSDSIRKAIAPLGHQERVQIVMQILSDMDISQLKNTQDALWQYMKDRRRSLGIITSVQLQVGSIVEASGSKSKYLGLGVVQKMGTTRAHVKFEGAPHQIWTVPFDMVTPVTDDRKPNFDGSKVVMLPSRRRRGH